MKIRKREQMENYLRSEICNQLWDQFNDQVNINPTNPIKYQLWHQLGEELWGQLRDSLQQRRSVK